MARSTDPGHGAALRGLGLAAPAKARLEAYLALLAAWNRRVNLTGASTAADQVAVLVEAVLPLRTLLGPGDLIDVGSGNGSPGLVIAALDPGRGVCLLEPRARRWAFLREAARAMGRPEVRVLRCRHDAYPGPPAANVTLRALRVPAPELLPLLSAGGRLFVLGGSPPEGPGLVLTSSASPGGIHVLERPDVPRET